MAASTRWPRHGPSRLRHVGHAHGHILRRKCWSWGHVWKSIDNYTSLKTYMIGIFLGYRVPLSLSPGLSSFSPLKLPFKHTHKPMNIGDKNQDPPHGGLTNRDILGDPRILDWWQKKHPDLLDLIVIPLLTLMYSTISHHAPITQWLL